MVEKMKSLKVGAVILKAAAVLGKHPAVEFGGGVGSAYEVPEKLKYK